MGFIADWMRRRRLRGRAVFSYHDGLRTRYADPYVLYRRLTADSEIDLVAVAQGYDDDNPEDTDALVALTRKVFDLPEMDEGTGRGLTSGEVIGLYFQYNDYIDEQKKSISTGPTSPEATDSESSTIPAVPVRPKRPSSGSPSTSPEPTPEPPIEPCEECAELSGPPLEGSH